MKLFGLVVLVLAVFAMLMGSTSAHPKAAGGLKKGVKAVKTGVGIVGAAGTAREIYEQHKNRKG